jgi:hypothetical protein
VIVKVDMRDLPGFFPKTQLANLVSCTVHRSLQMFAVFIVPINQSINQPTAQFTANFSSKLCQSVAGIENMKS